MVVYFRDVQVINKKRVRICKYVSTFIATTHTRGHKRIMSLMYNIQNIHFVQNMTVDKVNTRRISP